MHEKQKVEVISEMVIQSHISINIELPPKADFGYFHGLL